MLVQALVEYADRELADQLADGSQEEKPVPYLIELDAHGRFLNITSRFHAVPAGKKTRDVPAQLSVPRSPVARNSGLYPLLAADDIKYVLGIGPWTKEKQKQNHEERHRAFIAFIEKAARETGDDSLKACAEFYARPEEVERARAALAGALPNPVVALSFNGPVVNQPAVRHYWREHYRTASEGRLAASGKGECLISGRWGPVAPTHEKIKGLSNLGGQGAGVALMSFDKEAFCSYGWEQNANSPVAPDRAMAYVLALNDLLKPGSRRRRDISGVAFVFWTREHTTFDPMSIIEQPDEAEVDELLRLQPTADPDPNLFYMAGLGANGGRLIVRYWVSETLARVKANQKAWFEGLAIADIWKSGLAPHPRLWQLLRALDRDAEPPKHLALAFIRRAIEGTRQRLGYEVLSAALTRLRAAPDTRSDTARMGLIRLCLNDLRKEGEAFMSARLDPGQDHPAYLCGRLLSVYESLQYAAFKSAGESEVNQSVADRYYSLASTYPEIAFPKIVDLGRKHLRKLRKPASMGIAVNIEKEIDALSLAIEQAAGFRYPKALDLEGQGRFALGYHHQRAHQFEQARNRKEQENQQ